MIRFSFHLPLFLLLLSSLSSPCPAKPVSYNIQVFSEMPSPMTVGCHARDNFLGTKTIPWSFMYQFNFTVETDIGAQNFAYCDMDCRPANHGRFVVFDYGRDTVNCATGLNCQWFVRPDGIYEYFNNQKNLIYRW